MALPYKGSQGCRSSHRTNIFAGVCVGCVLGNSSVSMIVVRRTKFPWCFCCKFIKLKWPWFLSKGFMEWLFGFTFINHAQEHVRPNQLITKSRGSKATATRETDRWWEYTPYASARNGISFRAAKQQQQQHAQRPPTVPLLGLRYTKQRFQVYNHHPSWIHYSLLEERRVVLPDTGTTKLDHSSIAPLPVPTTRTQRYYYYYFILSRCSVNLNSFERDATLSSYQRRHQARIKRLTSSWQMQ